ncbi:hypothetical protein [Pseudophaeobacter flagellatus]|uniref:hypothetical protein n=1 Tax=Pseudophaeobacter flagellatus TaxID=2899119 RepID=UPI001E37C78C|nr:hypothetical protein [Pseudophaeobacter flagellatus]MCD9148853.1 hypothetical protein [Pseudophaeobacter flagellatus]
MTFSNMGLKKKPVKPPEKVLDGCQCKLCDTAQFALCPWRDAAPIAMEASLWLIIDVHQHRGHQKNHQETVIVPGHSRYARDKTIKEIMLKIIGLPGPDLVSQVSSGSIAIT